MEGVLQQIAAFQLHGEWRHFVGLLVVISLALLQKRVGRGAAFWQICWFLPGTLLHVFYRKVIR